MKKMLAIQKGRRLALCAEVIFLCLTANCVIAEPETARTPTKEESYVEQARQALLQYLDVELDQQVEVRYDDDIGETSICRVQFEPADGIVYRVVFGEDGIHRVYGGHTGEPDFWPENGEHVNLTAWAARWDEAWLREGEMSGNGLEMAGETGSRMLEIEREAEAFLQTHDIFHMPWEGKWECNLLVTDSTFYNEFTDIMVILRYPNGSGIDMDHAGSSIDVGYSLYFKQVMYLSLVRDANG